MTNSIKVNIQFTIAGKLKLNSSIEINKESIPLEFVDVITSKTSSKDEIDDKFFCWDEFQESLGELQSELGTSSIVETEIVSIEEVDSDSDFTRSSFKEVAEYFAVPFCDDETATMYLCDISADIDQTNITYDQVKYIFNDNNEEIPEGYTLDQMIAELMYSDREDENGNHYSMFCYQFSNLAIIDKKHYESLSEITDKLWEQCGDDSSTYKACEIFNSVVKTLATKVIDITSNINIVE
jgi:hypothetical protein